MPSSKVPPGHFLLLYFAAASSYTGKESEVIEAPLALSKLFGYLEHEYNGISSRVLDSCLVTVNMEYVEIPEGRDSGNDLMINAGDEVAIIPPVSSG